MDRALLSKSLNRAEEHVSVGQEHVTRQRQLIDKIRRNGFDTTDAESLLRQLEELQVLHIADRDRLKELLKIS